MFVHSVRCMAVSFSVCLCVYVYTVMLVVVVWVVSELGIGGIGSGSFPLMLQSLPKANTPSRKKPYLQ